MADVRSKNFATIVYPDDNLKWKDLLDSLHINYLVSPLHDMDINDDGKLKKPHRHIVLVYDSLKSLKQVKLDVNLIGGVGCEIVKSLVAYARYLCHLDDGEKAQYSTANVIAKGINYDKFLETEDTYSTMLINVIKYVRENNILDFADLVDTLVDNGDFSILNGVIKNSYTIREYMKCRRYREIDVLKGRKKR